MEVEMQLRKLKNRISILLVFLKLLTYWQPLSFITPRMIISGSGDMLHLYQKDAFKKGQITCHISSDASSQP